MEKEKDKITYDYYAMAFIDILGQKEAFIDNEIYIDSYKSPLTSNREEMKKRLLKAHEETATVVQRLRNSFEDGIKQLIRDPNKPPPAQISQDKVEQYKETIQADVSLHTFSDCILVSTCLTIKKYYGSVLTSIYHILVACEGRILGSLAIGKPFRAVIDVGMGTKLKNGEIYGPISSRIYEIERNIVQYPRIVIGDELKNFLLTQFNQPHAVDENDAKYCKQTAANCLARIKKRYGWYKYFRLFR